MKTMKKYLILVLLFVLFLVSVQTIAQTAKVLEPAATSALTIPLEAIKPLEQKETPPTEAVQPIVIDIQKADEIKTIPEGCKNLCGDGICQEIVCLAIGCPCPETNESCPQDCSMPVRTVEPVVALPPEVTVKISPLEVKPIEIEEREVVFKGVEKTPKISLEVKPALPEISTVPQTVFISIDEEKKVANIEVEGIVAVTKETLKFGDTTLKIETPKAEIAVNVMPNTAVEIAITAQPQNIKDVELKVVEEKAVYEIEGVRDVKILWIIPVSMSIKTEIDAQDGEVVKVEKPWWSFLAF